MAMLDKRLKRMEERVIKIVPKEDQARISTIGRAVVKPAIPGLPPKTANDKKRGASTAFAEDLGEWSRSRPGAPRKPSANATAHPEESEDNRLLQEGTESLPSRELQLHLAEVYFDFVYGQGYHLLHKPSFIRKLEAGQVPPVLILAVCAIAARFSSHPDIRTEPAFLRGEDWASAAREIALKRYDAPNITILIVYLILGLHEFGTCQGGRSWMLGGMAQRMAYALQLHKDPDHDANGRGRSRGASAELSFTDREIRRRTMWACFMMDRFNSSGTERPIFVNEQFIQSQLPIKEHYFQFEIPGVTEVLEHVDSENIDLDTGETIDPKDNMGVAAYKIRLVAIWGQLIRYLNLGGKERDPHPMWSEESGFAKLRSTVKHWKSSLPSPLTWTIENLQTHASERIANQFVFMHIIHNQIVLFLNRFALPSPGSRSSNAKDMPQAFVTECGRTALEAANQISVLINEAMDYRVVAPFAGYCAFFASTVHIYGVFSKNPALEASSKQNLAINVKYLTKMKKHWGMFHFVTENLKDLYRKHADAALRGPQPSHTPTGQRGQESIFQYGDWFDRYPNGVSGTDFEDPVADVKKEPGADAVLGQKSDLQSVEEFFSKLGPPTRTAQQKKAARKKRSKTDAQPSQAGTADSQSTANSTAVPEAAQQQIVPQTMSQQQQQQQQQPQRHQHQLPSAYTPMPPQPLQRQSSFNNTAPQQQQQHHSFAQTLSHDLTALQQRPQQHNFSSLLPQPQQADHDMLNTPYTSVEPQQQQAHLPQPSSYNPNNPFDLDLNAFSFDTANLWDQGSGWFMPFNMEPPNMLTDDSGLFGGGNLGAGAGGHAGGMLGNDASGFDMSGLFGDFAGLAGSGDGFAPDGSGPGGAGHEFDGGEDG